MQQSRAELSSTECHHLAFKNNIRAKYEVTSKTDVLLDAEDAKFYDEGQQQMQTSSRSGDNNGPMFVVSKYGTKQIMFKQHTFNRHISREDVTYWRCSQFAVLRCRARLKTKSDTLTILNSEHNHEVITKTRKYGSLKRLKAAEAAAKIVSSVEKAE